ncbi:MAG: MBL fold metallo-hydrolase [Alphaproteobacteria bacterium]
MTPMPSSQIPGFYHRRIGDIHITAVSDGYLDGDMGVLRGIGADEAQAILAAAFRPVPGRRTSVNCFLVWSAGRLALIDTGSGDYMMPTAGRLQANLAAAGVDPAAIDTVLLTHMHPDHSAGLTDMKTGRPYFPNAELVFHENEHRHWFDDAAMARADERARRLNFQAAREQTEPYRDRWRMVREGEVFPGVTAIPAPGHTPGHTTYLLASGDAQLLVWADTVHLPEVQTARPEVTVVYDIDPAGAQASRRRVFDRVAADGLLVTGMHLHFPGFSYLKRAGDAYALVPEAWSPTM